MQEEQRHLQETLTLIRDEHTSMAKKKEEMTEQVRRMRISAGGTYDNDLMVQEFVLQRVCSEVLGLHLAMDHPYFSRIDFTPAKGASETHYIGKHGVMDSHSLQSMVADWRSPIANLYYSGQIGPAYYEAPDGLIDGELTLKRMFTIEEGKMISALDMDIMAQDRLLVDALSAVSSDRLKEVVTTIQTEQNTIIRHPLNVPLIVQGVAGSGKTTIALHRIAYLLYAHAETLAPANLMILAPNPLFLRYISAVLPDLGVENARQTTFALLAADLLEKNMPPVRPGETLDELLDDPQKAQLLRESSRLKGSLAFGERLTAYLDALEVNLFPQQDITFGPATLIRHKEMQRMFCKDLTPFPWRRRVQELTKIAKKRLKDTSAQLERLMQDACTKRADIIRSAMEDGPERRERLTALYQTRDDRLAEIEEKRKAFVKSIPTLWPKLNTLEIYQDFLRKQPEFAEEETQKTISTEDLPPLLLIEMRLGEMKNRPRVQHTIIDEAQDFSPLALFVLKELFRCGFTLVGDMGQGIYRYRGMDSWQEATQALPGAQMHVLRTSYRSTVEIMEFANRLAMRHPYPEQILAQPVLRHGDIPQEIRCQNEKERIEALCQLARDYQNNGMHSIAILARDTKAAKKLLPILTKEGLPARLLDPDADEYQGGMLIASATTVKGLEFDAVIIADANKYPDDLTGTRLLYVCATRALHKLAILS